MRMHFSNLRCPFVLVLGLLGACGPMNKVKTTAYGSNESPSTLAGMSSVHNTFYVHTSLQPTEESTSATPVAQLGDNTYVMRVVRAADLAPLTAAAKVRLSYFMPDMPAMGTSDAIATLQADGSYVFTLFYSMSGLWRSTLTIEDGNLQDDFSFETSL